MPPVRPGPARPRRRGTLNLAACDPVDRGQDLGLDAGKDLDDLLDRLRVPREEVGQLDEPGEPAVADVLEPERVASSSDLTMNPAMPMQHAMSCRFWPTSATSRARTAATESRRAGMDRSARGSTAPSMRKNSSRA